MPGATISAAPGAGADSAVALNGHLYVVGSTTDDSGNTDGVLMEISTLDGSVISTTSYGRALYNTFNSITTDGTYLYVAGKSKSYAGGGNAVGESDAILLTYDPGFGSMSGQMLVAPRSGDEGAPSRSSALRPRPHDGHKPSCHRPRPGTVRDLRAHREDGAGAGR